jgi:hypothetical protein
MLASSSGSSIGVASANCALRDTDAKRPFTLPGMSVMVTLEPFKRPRALAHGPWRDRVAPRRAINEGSSAELRRKVFPNGTLVEEVRAIGVVD